jgi:hypothetical protein
LGNQIGGEMNRRWVCVIIATRRVLASGWNGTRDSTGDSNLPAGDLHMLMYHGDLLSTAVPQPRERRGPILEGSHEASGGVYMPGLVYRIATILHLCKLAHRVNVSRRHLVREQLFDAVLRLDRLGGVNGDV